MNDYDEPSCPYCGLPWYSAHSEGAPCGVDGCMVFNCCDKSFEEHCKREHPEYYEENYAKRRSGKNGRSAD